MRIRLKQFADLVGGGLFLTLFVVFIVQIAARFGFGKPLAWTDEAAVILYVWVILWGCAAVVPEREHVVFDLLWNSSSLQVRRWMCIAGNTVLGGLALTALPATWGYVRFMARETSPVLGIPFMWIFLPFLLLLVSLVVRSAWNIWEAIKGRGLQLELGQ